MAAWQAVLFWWLMFAGTHLVLSSLPVRRPLIARLGERGFQGLYSLVAAGTFVPLVWVFWRHKHAGPLLWEGRGIAVLHGLAMLLALAGVVLVVLSFVQPSPLGMTPGGTMQSRGVMRITRHPLFAGIGLWGLGHAVVNGFLGDVIFFGGFLIFGLIGAWHQDTRKRAGAPEEVRRFFWETSLLPFAAIAGGRNRFAAHEIRWAAVGVGVALALLLYALHPRLFVG